MRFLRTILISAAAGLLIGLVLFFMTAPFVSYLGCPIGNGATGTDFRCDVGGTDAWTGEFRPLTQSYTDVATGKRVTRIWGGVEYEENLIIPIPVGFAAGCLVTLGLITIVRRARRTASDPGLATFILVVLAVAGCTPVHMGGVPRSSPQSFPPGATDIPAPGEVIDGSWCGDARGKPDPHKARVNGDHQCALGEMALTFGAWPSATPS
jgi:hypothetical protein